MAMSECTRLFADGQGVLDAEGYAKTYWIGTMDDVARELRRSLRKREELQKKMAEQQKQQQEQQQQEQQGMIQDAKNEKAKQVSNDNDQNDKDRQAKLIDTTIKMTGKNNVKPQPQTA